MLDIRSFVWNVAQSGVEAVYFSLHTALEPYRPCNSRGVLMLFDLSRFNCRQGYRASALCWANVSCCELYEEQINGEFSQYSHGENSVSRAHDAPPEDEVYAE